MIFSYSLCGVLWCGLCIVLFGLGFTCLGDLRVGAVGVISLIYCRPRVLVSVFDLRYVLLLLFVVVCFLVAFRFDCILLCFGFCCGFALFGVCSYFGLFC